MFDMFKLMGQLPRIKGELEKMQERLGDLTADGDAGGGMVKARVNGRMELLSVSISDEALKLNDREMLEEMVKGAVGQALQRARQQSADEMSKLATSLGLPPGFKLPGLG